MKLHELLSLPSESSNIPAVPEYAKPSYQKTLQGLEAIKKAGIKLVPYAINSIYKNPVYIYDNGGRYTVVVDMGSFTAPFYWSTGLGGKVRVPPDHWYPFFGIGPNGWINKGSEDDILAFYGSPTLKRIAQILDSSIRPRRDVVNVAGWGGFNSKQDIEPQFMKVVNSGFTPISSDDNSEAAANQHVANMNNFLKKVGGKQYKRSTKSPDAPKEKPHSSSSVPSESEPVRGPLTLLYNGKPVLGTLNLSTKLGRGDVKKLGPDYQYWSEQQFILTRDLKQGTWTISPDPNAVNKTIVDGQQLTLPVVLRSGMKIAVGNPAKNIEKLPLIVS